MNGYPQPTKGNGTVLVLYNPNYTNTPANGMAFISEVILAPLMHLGIPFQLIDANNGLPNDDTLNSIRAVVVAHEGVWAHLTQAEGVKLLQAVEHGLGLFSLDHNLDTMPVEMQQVLQLYPATHGLNVQEIAFASDHSITATREPGEVVHLPRPISVLPPRSIALPWRTLVSDSATGAPLLACRLYGAGRIVQWFMPASLWTKAVFGHGMGLDDIFWKGLVWMARKPLAMKPMPPFVTIRMDDCQGSGGFWYTLQACLYGNSPLPEPYRRMILDRVPGRSSCAYRFGYIDVFHRHGYHVHMGVYPDQIRSDDMTCLQRYWQQGWLEFSIHAFADYYNADNGNINDFLYMRDHVRVGRGKGQVIEESEEVLAQKFARIDAWLAQWGIESSPVINPHYANPGVNSLPFLKARGWQYMMFGLPFGKPYDANIEADWRKGPYGHNGFILDYLPIPPEASAKGIEPNDFFTAVGHPYDYSPSEIAIDFVSGDYTMKMGAMPSNDIAACAGKFVQQIRRGVDARFFGCPKAHEQGLAVLTKDELDDLLSIANKKLQKYELIHAPYATIAAYAKAKADTHVDWAETDERQVRLHMVGEAAVPLQIEVYTNQEEGVACTTHTVRPFSGEINVTV